MSLRTQATLALVVSLLLFATGCQAVRPWERGHLARRDMSWDPDTLETQRRGHVYFSKEAALSGGGGGGGGCGCN